ncbi:MAG: CotH kinase family protein [Atopobiaceae bacterium]|nr:CotH kinase family protein [Atopobiaceae bacterium]MBR1829568.1 CotH kinase family protein [Atopobiaceae bacterium]
MHRLPRRIASAAFALALLVTTPSPAIATEQPVPLDELASVATDSFPPTNEEDTPIEANETPEEGFQATQEAETPALLAEEELSDEQLTAQEDSYQGGSIPIMRFTFYDDIDPETGEVIMTGDEKIEEVYTAPNHSYRATGVSVTIEVPPNYDNPEEDLWDGVSEYAGETDLSIEYFRGRGNSTWRNRKRPFKFKLENRADLFGMGSSKHWTLLANFSDKSLSLDRLVGWLGDQMGMPYTPRGVPVDIYLNDQYYGSYLLAEEVRIDRSRVEIDEVDEDASDLDSLDITGGYLFGTNRMPASLPYEYFHTSRGTTFCYESPEYEPPLSDAQTAQQRYLTSFLDRLEDAIYGDGFVNENGEGVWDLMDEQSTADMWLVQEFLCNPDAYGTPSTYLYKLRDSAGADGSVTTGKLYWGPLWDFDFVWGQDTIEGFDFTSYQWLNLLRQDPEFVEVIKERWKVLDAALYELDRPGGMLDQYIDELEGSWNADYVHWNKDQDEGPVSIQEAIETLRSRFEARRSWFNEHLDELQTNYHLVRFVVDDTEIESYYHKDGYDYSPGAPPAPEKEGLIYDGWKTTDGVVFDEEAPVYEDMTFYATYLDPATLVPATEIYFPFPEIWMRYGVSLEYDLFPLNAQDTRIEWSSSDESVLTVNKGGFVIPQVDEFDETGKAEAIVTAHLVGSGNEASVRVVLYDSDIVKLPEPTSISVDERMALDVDTWQQVRLETSPAVTVLNEDYDMRYESEDESIATVSRTGVVYGVAPGVVTVKMKWMDLMDGTVIEEHDIVVTVSERAEPEPEPEPTPTPEPEPTPEPTPSPTPAPTPTPERQDTPKKNAALPQTGDLGQTTLVAPMVVCAAAALLLAHAIRER